MTAALLVLAAASLVVELWALLPVPGRFSWRWVGIFVVLFALAWWLAWAQTRFFTMPACEELGRGRRLAWAITAGALALLLLAYAAPDATRVMERLPWLAPVERLELRPVLDADRPTIDVWKVKIGEARLSAEGMKIEGDWRAEGDHLLTSDPQARLVVEARVPRAVSVVFMRAPEAGQVLARWDGQERVVDLRGDLGEEEHAEFRFDPRKRETPPLAWVVRLLTLPAWAALAFWATGVLFVGWRQ